MQQKEQERRALQEKFEEERRRMLETDSEQWVRVLLQSSKTREGMQAPSANPTLTLALTQP